MDKKFFKRWMPDPKTVQESKYFRWLGPILYSQNLWHLNRTSVSRAVAIGLFWGLMPPFVQAIPAALMAIWLRANVGISLLGTCVSNVFTIPPLLYFEYRVGAWVLGRESVLKAFHWNWADNLEKLKHIWWPMILGCVIVGGLSALVGYWAVQIGWRWKSVASHRGRKQRRLAYRALRRGPGEISKTVHHAP